MPTTIELLQGLREGYVTLAYQDDDKLRELSNRGRMFVFALGDPVAFSGHRSLLLLARVASPTWPAACRPDRRARLLAGAPPEPATLLAPPLGWGTLRDVRALPFAASPPRGGKSWGSIRQGAPALTIHRKASKTSRRSWVRWGASWRTRAR